jgi:CubicO group peptidase (beta-lactamase class C family)
MSLATASPTLQHRLDALREKHGVPGASLAVLADGDVRSVASGLVNMDTGVETTADSLFQIGSITKVWTGTVVMKLVEEGLVELDAPVRRYLPDFRVADESVAESVTIRHLLTHTSGIDGDHFADTGRGDDALARYVESCAELPQVHPLGATMSYCNTGFSILGRVVEVVTDGTWDEAIRTRLSEPLGLAHTATLPEDVLRFRAAIGHIEPPGHERSTAPMWGLPRSAGPAGGVCSSATDLLGFAALHLGDGTSPTGERLLREDSLAAMREPFVVVPSGIGSFADRWGLGWSIHEWSGRQVVGHDGGTIGQTAFLRVVPEAGVAVALFTNGGNAMPLFRELGGGLLREAAGIELPAEPVPLAEQPTLDPSPYVGTYERAGASFEVTARDGGLVAVQTVTGLGSELTPDPLELPLHVLDPNEGFFLTQHPVAPGLWLPVRFVTLSDGSRCLHIGGRATPKV